MSISRREFVHLAALAAGSAASLSLARAAAAARFVPPFARAPKKILILGGTAFLGPACIRAAVDRGHKVTIFNRGRIEQLRKEKGRPLDIPEGVEVIYGNRDPDKTADEWKDESKGQVKKTDSPKGLSGLEGKTWDAVIDTSGYFPRIVKASATLLGPNIKQYVFISSISAYARMDAPDLDETTELATMKDPTVEEFQSDPSNYGGGKALCEKAAQEIMPGKTTIVRPGFIVGPGDASHRFLYWPLRAQRGGEAAVPGKPTDPIQVIDVRDLAEWTVRLIEAGTMGTFNATGPTKPHSFRAMLDGCNMGAGASTSFTWIDPEFISSHGLDPEEFPLWVSPDSGEQRGIQQVSIKRALAAGLTFRPIDDTAKASLEWYRSLSDEGKKVAGQTSITPEREAELLKAWKTRS